MRIALKILSIFVVMAAFGFVAPHLSGGYLSAAEDCDNDCDAGDGTCEPFEGIGLLDCCGGHCQQYEGDDPVFWCEGRCSITHKVCDCTQIGCHSFCP